MKSLSDILYKRALESGGNMDAYTKGLVGSLGPAQMGHNQGAITEAAIRSGYNATPTAFARDFGGGLPGQTPGVGSGILYQTLRGGR